MFILLLAEVVAYCHRTQELVLLMFGGHPQQLGHKSRLVFYSLQIVPQSPAEKALYVSLKLLPSLIRFLLIHGTDLPSLRLH
jgi:hypothetical protein